MSIISTVYPDVVMELVLVLNVTVNRGVVWDVEPTGTEAVFVE